jgi:hypothetical protein
MVLEALSGGILGGVLRMAPEVLKLADRITERKHELAMQKLELQFAKLAPKNGSGVVPFVPESSLALMREAAIADQQERAARRYPFIDVVSSLVRPTVTWSLLALYAGVRISALALGHGGYGDVDLGLFSSVLSFWFLNRSISKP